MKMPPADEVQYSKNVNKDPTGWVGESGRLILNRPTIHVCQIPLSSCETYRCYAVHYRMIVPTASRPAARQIRCML